MVYKKKPTRQVLFVCVKHMHGSSNKYGIEVVISSEISQRSALKIIG